MSTRRPAGPSEGRLFTRQQALSHRQVIRRGRDDHSSLPQIVLDQVLMVSDGDAVKLGNPLVSGAKVSATVLGHGRGAKVKIFKMRRRKHYQRTQGHRQNYTEIRVDAIA